MPNEVEAAKRRIAEMEHDKETVAILTNKRHHRHAEVMAERARLYETTYPQGGTR